VLNVIFQSFELNMTFTQFKHTQYEAYLFQTDPSFSI